MSKKFSLLGLVLCGTMGMLESRFAAAPPSDSNNAAWPAAVPGFVPPKPGEHPRLLFRKADVPALKKKAATPEGKAMIARLKEVLGGGEAMPRAYSQAAPVNSGGVKVDHPVGEFTISHGAGFGLLYQLTGDKKYAEFARQCVEKIFEGQVDRDSRYNYLTPGTGFRLGPVYEGITLAYDMSYDAWPEDYRKSVVERLQTFAPTKVDDAKKQFTLEDLAKAGGYPPGSNHYGSYILAPGMVALAFRGDPGADDKRLETILSTVEASLQKQLGGGFGDHGWFPEGTSCGRISSNGLLPLLQSLKIAAGKDYISPRPHGRYTVLRLMHEIVPTDGGPQVPHRGDYGSDTLFPNEYSHSFQGDFPVGMGSVLPNEAAAIAWIYDRFVEPGEKKNFGAAYPHQVISALVNWPATTIEPDKVLPKVIADDIHGYYVARNRWQDKDDTIVTTLLKRGPGGYKSGKVQRGTLVWSFGSKLKFGGLEGATTHFRAGADGSMELADEKGSLLVVDFSGTSTAPVLLAATGNTNVNPGKNGKATVLNLNGVDVTVLTLGPGEQPEPKADASTITVGAQTITLENGKLTLGKFTEVKK